MNADSKKRGLGRGLDALFGEARREETARAREAASPARAPSTGNVPQPTVPPAQAAPAAPAVATDAPRRISVERLTPGKFQPRRQFNDDAINQLADSIAVHGILQPIVARPLGNIASPMTVFEIIAGERRWRAAQKAQLHEVPVILRELDDQQALEFGLIENLQREDLTALEEAEGYQRLMDEFGHTQEQLAQQLGKSRSHIANTLRLLKLPGAIAAHVMNGSLSAGHARALIGVKNAEEIAATVIKRGLSVRQTEKLVQAAEKPAGKKGAARPAFRQKDVDILALEEKMTQLLGLRVGIDNREGGQGVLTIEYKSLEQLDDVLERLSSVPHGK
jgi:ParB family chromosome partitioning protein